MLGLCVPDSEIEAAPKDDADATGPPIAAAEGESEAGGASGGASDATAVAPTSGDIVTVPLE